MTTIPTPLITEGYAQLDGIKLHYAESGSGETLVILLHGFPEFWYSWRHQLPVIGAKYHAVAPDLRGYNLSDKPPRVEDYTMELLVKDVVNLIHFFGKEKAVLIGHDWGAAIAWAVAQRHPQVVSKLAALQVPPTQAWQANFTVRQLLSSWYMFFFQLPKIPEWWARRNNFVAVEKMYKESSFRPGAFSDEDIVAYKTALKQPGALTSGLNYYRANVFRSLLPRRKTQGATAGAMVHAPTLFIYGELDVAVRPSTVRGINRYVEAPYTEVRIPDSGHWVQNEAISEVNTALMKFLDSDDPQDGGQIT